VDSTAEKEVISCSIRHIIVLPLSMAQFNAKKFPYVSCHWRVLTISCVGSLS